MKAMRYINLLDKISHVKTNKCFLHNNSIFFAVNKKEVSKAIGVGAINTRKMQERIGKKIKIIREAEGIQDVKRVIEDIVSPVKFKSLEIKENSLFISAGNNQSKASLIGRNRRRYEELKKIVHDLFNLDLKII
ncbi:MAG: hypothetical protein AABY10_05395 [Nanoarchaeota archaeon]